LCTNHVCLSDRDFIKSSQKGAKENKEEKEIRCWTAEHRTVMCHPPDSPVHGQANSLLSGFSACVGHNSPDDPREAPDSSVSQQPTASGHVGPGQRSSGALDGPVPPEQEISQSRDSLSRPHTHC
jgi:hypothetical protein